LQETEGGGGVELDVRGHGKYSPLRTQRTRRPTAIAKMSDSSVSSVTSVVNVF
jgi:hypothetical protein